MKILGKYMWALLTIGFFCACESLVDDLNTDPNNPGEAPVGTILTGAQVATIVFHEGDPAVKAGLWTGYFTGSARQFLGFGNYTISSNDFDVPWENLYNGVIRNAKTVEKQAEENNNPVTAGIAKVLQAHAFGSAASMWGDVPFSEAGLNAFDNPAFESQSPVFSAVQTLLDEAILDLERGTGPPTAGSDIYFDGNAARWIATAHTLKARYFLLERDYASAYASAQSGINEAGGSMLAPHSTAQGAQNLYFQFNGGQRLGDITMEEAFIKSLIDTVSLSNRENAKTNEAARYAYYVREIDGISYPNFVDGYFTQDRYFPLVSYEENLLILAEAGLRTQDLNTSLNHLNDFRAHMNNGGYIDGALHVFGLQYDPYLPEDFQNGGMENTDGLSDENALLREILEERYVTFYGQLIGFDDLRRTLDENVVRVPVPPRAGDLHAQRFLYPQTEIDNNLNTPDPVPDIFQVTSVNQ